MSEVLTIVKLGGSVVTDKERPFSFRPQVLGRMAEELRISGLTPIVVHGTGKAGKAYARHYAGTGGSTSRWSIFQLTTRAIRELQARVSDALFEAGVANCPIPANALFRQGGDGVSWHDPSPVSHLAERGVAPVLCGDVLVEQKEAFRIISSDRIMPLLADRLPVARAVFVTDVDGVFDDGGRLVADLSPSGGISSLSSDAEDVTGGMAAKAEAAFDLARRGVAVTIVSGLVPGRVRAALAGDPVVGTRVDADGVDEEVGGGRAWAIATK